MILVVLQPNALRLLPTTDFKFSQFIAWTKIIYTLKSYRPHKLRSEFGAFFAALCKKDDKFTESDLMRLLALGEAICFAADLLIGMISTP
jgi:hypothetical protein